MKERTHKNLDQYSHKRWHIVPVKRRRKVVAYQVFRFGLLPGNVLVAAEVGPGDLSRDGRESLICGAHASAMWAEAEMAHGYGNA